MGSGCVCHDFLRLVLTSIRDRIEHENWYICNFEESSSPDEGESIRTSGKTCQLCPKIHSYRQYLYKPGRQLSDKEVRRLIEMSIYKSFLNGEENLISSIIFDGNTETTSRAHPPTIYFSAWADQETPASRDFVTRPPVLQGSPEEISASARKLLYSCLDHHEDCMLVEPEEEFDLPSRVLSIKNDAGCISLKLVESKGSSGRYCALSHCWGSEDKRPLLTTQKNFTDHLASISWDHLPPLFRDAITLTKDLGIKYLWIDSLCIVQDDKQDWLSESKKMALVYQRATLVIAAMDSEDSTQRLSKINRPEPLTLRIPYYTKDGSAQGCYNIAPVIPVSFKDTVWPLRERGWAFQELYLGRRKIFFTSKGIFWKCNEKEVDDRGNKKDLGLYETMSWLTCLNIYTEKHLTFPSDRLIALLGIVGEVGKSRTDSFVSELGVWEDQLAEQLLWRAIGTQHKDLLDLPSWSWAATSGAKAWLEIEDPREATVNGTPQTVKLKEMGSLGASGLLLKPSIALSPLQDCCTQHQEDELWAGCLNLERSVMPGYWGEHDYLERFPILNPDGTRDIYGLAIFDHHIDHSECFCFILASSHRNLDDPCYLDSDKSFSGGAESDIEDGKNSLPGYVHRDTDECVDIFEVGRSMEIYWALLLQPVDETLEKFTRVGMALLWPRALETHAGELKEFEIV